jgi:hypothetical protein
VEEVLPGGEVLARGLQLNTGTHRQTPDDPVCQGTYTRLHSSLSVTDLGKLFLMHPSVRAAAIAGNEIAGLLIGRRRADGSSYDLVEMRVDPASNIDSPYNCELESWQLAEGLELIGWIHLHPDHPNFLSLYDVRATQVRADSPNRLPSSGDRSPRVDRHRGVAGQSGATWKGRAAEVGEGVATHQAGMEPRGVAGG